MSVTPWRISKKVVTTRLSQSQINDETGTAESRHSLRAVRYRLRCKRSRNQLCEPYTIVQPAYEAGYFWSVDQLVLGQRSRDVVAGAVPRFGCARSRDPLL